MRCFACDVDLGQTAPMDRATSRWYCIVCFEPTLQVQLAAASVEIEWARITESETNFSYKGVADILETEGWAAFSDAPMQEIVDYYEEEVDEE